MMVLNPQTAFRSCVGFIENAWKSSSIYQKISIIPVALFTLVLVIPAALQYGLQKAIIEPLQKTTQERAALLNNQVKSTPIISKVNHLDKNLVEIDDPNPVSALATLQSLLQTHPDKIPVFSIKTQQAVNQYLKEMNQLAPHRKASAPKKHSSEVSSQEIETDRRKPASLNAFKPQQKPSDISTETNNVSSPTPARRPS